MKRALAALITMSFLAVALWYGRGAPSHESAAAASTPADCIERMFAAAERGDVDGYLDCFTGAQRERLDREMASQPRQEYARSLLQSVKDLKGRAVFDAPTSDAAFDRATVTVERVYVHRIDRQTYRFKNESGEWRITEVETPAALQPAKAYGQPVFELAPVVEETPASDAADGLPEK